MGKHKDEPKSWARSIRDVQSLHVLKLHEIETAHVTEALKPIWWEKPISANRTRERIEKLLDAAKVEKFRTGENPAAWRGNLKFVLPSARKLNKKKGHASVPYSKAPALMTALRYEPGNAARCVEVGILTCARSQEIRLMEWDEIDFDAKQWTCPAEKMKIKGRERAQAAFGPAVGSGHRDHQVDAACWALCVLLRSCRRASALLPERAHQRDQARQVQRDDAWLPHHVPQLGRREHGAQFPP
jgi:integrase